MKTTRAVRRTASIAAIAALAGGGLVAGSSTANADDVVDVTGVVTNAAGAPLAGAFVTAFVQNGSQFYPVDSATADASGRYNLDDLDAATRNQDNPGTSPAATAIRNTTSVKLFFSKDVPDAELHSNPGYLSRAFGGTKTLTNSTAVPVNGTTATTANQALPNAGGMVVRVAGATGAPVTGLGAVDLFDASSDDPIDANANTPIGDTSDDDDFYDNPATVDVDESVNAPDDGLVYVYGVEPGSYVVNAGGADSDDTTGAFRNYLTRFIGGNGTFSDATPVTVTAGSFATTGLQLTDVLSTVKSPRILGDSSFGSTLVADPGVFLRQQGTEFSYQWTRNGVPVAGATLRTFTLSKADKKKKIGLTVTAVSAGEFVGTAAAEPTSKVGEKSKVRARSNGDLGFKVTVKAAKKKVAKKNGAVTGKVVLLTEEGEVASKKVKIKNGTATVTPKRQFLGEKNFRIKYLGAKKLGSDTAAAKLSQGKGKGKKKG